MSGTLHLPPHLRKAAEHPRPFDEAELGMLRDFYAAWEALHKIPKDKAHSKKVQEAAVVLVRQAHALRRLYG